MSSDSETCRRDPWERRCATEVMSHTDSESGGQGALRAGTESIRNIPAQRCVPETRERREPVPKVTL